MVNPHPTHEEWQRTANDLLDDLDKHIKRGALTPHMLRVFVTHWRRQIGGSE